jgi:hypothetical protein
MAAKRGRPKAVGATKEKVLSVRLESSAAAALETIGARFGVPQSQLIRQAISEYVQRNIGATHLRLSAQASAGLPSDPERDAKEAAFFQELDASAKPKS